MTTGRRPVRNPLHAALALCLLASACSPTIINHGYRLDGQKVAEVRPGVTSREEVQRLLGSPSSVGAFNDSRWYYISQRVEKKSFYQEKMLSQDVVEITFDGNGIVQNIATHDLKQARNITPDPEHTPAPGSDKTILQQFVGNLGRFNPTPPGGGPVAPNGTPGGVPGG